MTNQSLTCEEFEDRLAALHRASLELVRDISLETLLERIVVIACEQVGARYGAVGVFNSEGTLDNFLPVSAVDGKRPRINKIPAGLTESFMHSQEPVRLSKADSRTSETELLKQYTDVISFLCVPVHQGKELLGQIYLVNKVDDLDFSDDDQRVIETLASYASAALVNARLYSDLVERDGALTQYSENLTLLTEPISPVAFSDTDAILDKALSQIMDYLHFEVMEAHLHHEESKVQKLIIHREKGDVSVPALWTRSKFKLGEGVLGMTAKTGEPTVVNISECTDTALATQLGDDGFKQLVCFPLPGQKGILGVLSAVTKRSEPLNELEKQFLKTISAWLGATIENVRSNLHQRRVAVLEERERIGMDLHDGVIQSIYAVGLMLEHARLLIKEDVIQANQRVEQAIEDLNDTIRDIRGYILDLSPRQLHDESLLEGVKRLVNEFRANTLVEVRLQGPADGLANLSRSHALAIFHICQEALANIGKHSRARRVDVLLWSTSERVLLEVSDDGHGFEVNKAKFSLGHGLANMRTRARQVDGDVDFTSAPGEGTTILAWVPFEDESE
jgi:two-component system, NarL family, sensor histidine kinase DevS